MEEEVDNIYFSLVGEGLDGLLDRQRVGDQIQPDLRICPHHVESFSFKDRMKQPNAKKDDEELKSFRASQKEQLIMRRYSRYLVTKIPSSFRDPSGKLERHRRLMFLLQLTQTTLDPVSSVSTIRAAS